MDEYLNKLRELIEDLKKNEDDYNTWSIDFICNLEEQIYLFETGERQFTALQREKIDELYSEHLEE